MVSDMMRKIRMREHLSVRVIVDEKLLGETKLEDPFHTTGLVVTHSFWTCVKMLLSRKRRRTLIKVRVIADQVAQDRWFRVCSHCNRREEQSASTHVGG